MDKDRLEWLERIALESMKSRSENMDLITKEAHTTLTITLSALGITAGYAVQLIEKGGEGIWGYVAAFAAIHLVFTAFILVTECLILGDFPAIYNNPENLDRPKMDFDTLRMKEIGNIQVRIKDATRIVAQKSKWLNISRLMLLLTPLVVVFGYMIFEPYFCGL